MPQLVKLQSELKDTGFAIVGFHSQNGGQSDIERFGQQYKINFTLTSSGSVPGHNVTGLPSQFLFDTEGNLVATDHHIPPQKIKDLVAAEPHFLAYGRKYTKHKAEAEMLKKTKAYGPILKKLEKDAGSTGEAADEAKYLKTRILGYGTKKLEEAKTAENEDPFTAQQLYGEISANWSGAEPAEKASARLKELKNDKDFQGELKAGTLLHQILADCEKLIVQGGKINLEYALNKSIASGIRANVAALKKKHPDSKAAKIVAGKLEPYGFKGL